MASITTTDPNALSPAAYGLLQRACDELNRGETAAAGNILAKVLVLAPGNMEATRLTGIAALQEKDPATAVACFQQVLPSRPDDPSLHIQLGIALYQSGEVDPAITYLRRATELDPGSALAWFNLGEALRSRTQPEDALAALQRALQAEPTHIPAQIAIARVLSSIGRIDEAVHQYRQILKRAPCNPDAWSNLANLNTVRFGEDDVAQLRIAFARTDLLPAVHNCLGFALAKSLEDQGNFEEAFEVFHLANSGQRQLAKWDAPLQRARIDATIGALATWSPPPPTSMKRGHEVIFIVSLPRSGSTLVEQILVSHPDVEGANEIRDLADVIDTETKRRPEDFPAWVVSATPDDWQRLGADYLARTARWRQHKPRFTDKNLMTWHVVGPTLAMLPAARFVIVRRDPVETCLACYRQWLGGDTGFAYDLDDMADYCIDFMRLTRLWLEKFPDRTLDLEYETLVTQPEATVRRLLDFCGVSFDPACLAFHATPRTVMSAPSAAQVRQPLRQDTSRAARYGHKLDGLRARLREAGLAP